MANIEGKCPKCGGSLSIPEELETFSCMYCGEKLDRTQLIIPEPEEKKHQAASLEEKLEAMWQEDPEQAEQIIDQMLELDKYNALANQIYAKMHFNDVLFEHLNAMEYFTRSGYVDHFDQYKLSCGPIIETVDRYALEAPDRGKELMHQLAARLAEAAGEAVARDPKLRTKNAREIKRDQYKTILAVYTIPMILEMKLGISREFTDIIIEEWMRCYPKSVLRKGTYQDMVVGFRKGKMCFITTAVCGSFGKPDDCYELTSFRRFRDTYMMETEERRRLVEEYYETAPGIVACINLEASPENIYRSIWDRYLESCLRDIEAGRKESCGRRYEQMVRGLRARYLS